MTPVIHRAPLGLGALPCCGRTPSETDDRDHVTATGTVTCPGPIALPGPQPRGDIEALCREADELWTDPRKPRARA